VPSLPPTSTRLGARLWVSLFAIEAEWLHGESIEYDLQLDTPAGIKSLADLIPGGLHLTGAGLPSFMVPSAAQPLRMLHGSCRKPHGKGPEATHRWLEQLDAAASKPERPAVLVLHGDQIYADDVADPFLAKLMAFADQLLGYRETIPDGQGKAIALAKLLPGRRADFVRTQARMVVGPGERRSQLLGLGEFAAMYLAGLNPDLALVPSNAELDKAVRSAKGPDVDRAKQWRQELPGFRDGVAHFRRLCANIATYMIFDDHEVTDDWNLDDDWTAAVMASPAGQRVVTNALIAYWAFQAWGNDPDAYPEDWRKVIEEHCTAARTGANRAAKAKAATELIHDAASTRWSYTIPTRPAVEVLDVRTLRRDGANTRGVDLLADQGLGRLAASVRASQASADGRLLMVSSIPVVRPFERTWFRTREHKAEEDGEDWRCSPRAWYRLMSQLAAQGIRTLIVFSGDVHYGFAATSTVKLTGPSATSLRIVQLTSSALKNFDDQVAMKQFFTASRIGERTGYQGPLRSPWVAGPPPSSSASDKKEIELLLSKANPGNDLGSLRDLLDQPVVILEDRLAQLLALTAPVRMLWSESFAFASAPALTGDNNAALVVIGPDELTQRLLTSRGGEDTVHIRLR